MCIGKTRAEAVDRMKRALNEYIIIGVDTTIPFHLAVLNNKEFVKGVLTTNFIEKQHIGDALKKFRQKKAPLSNSTKTIIISTAVAKYLEKKQLNLNSRQNSWASAAKQEAINQGEQ